MQDHSNALTRQSSVPLTNQKPRTPFINRTKSLQGDTSSREPATPVSVYSRTPLVLPVKPWLKAAPTVIPKPMPKRPTFVLQEDDTKLDAFGYHISYDDYFRRLYVFHQQTVKREDLLGDYEHEFKDITENYCYVPYKVPINSGAFPYTPNGRGMLMLCHQVPGQKVWSTATELVIRAIRPTDSTRLLLVTLPRHSNHVDPSGMFDADMCRLYCLKSHRGSFTGPITNGIKYEKQCRKQEVYAPFYARLT